MLSLIPSFLPSLLIPSLLLLSTSFFPSPLVPSFNFLSPSPFLLPSSLILLESALCSILQSLPPLFSSHPLFSRFFHPSGDSSPPSCPNPCSSPSPLSLFFLSLSHLEISWPNFPFLSTAFKPQAFLHSLPLLPFFHLHYYPSSSLLLFLDMNPPFPLTIPSLSYSTCFLLPTLPFIPIHLFPSLLLSSSPLFFLFSVSLPLSFLSYISFPSTFSPPFLPSSFPLPLLPSLLPFFTESLKPSLSSCYQFFCLSILLSFLSAVSRSNLSFLSAHYNPS